MGSVNSRKLTPVVLAVAWLFSLCLVFGLGVFLSLAYNTSTGGGSSMQEPEQLAKRQALLSVEYLTERPMTPTQWQTLLDGAESEPFLQGIVRLLLAERDPVVREFHGRSIARALPLSAHIHVMRMAMALPQSQQRDGVLGVLIEQWSMVDGRSAVAFVRNQPLSSDLEPLLLRAIHGWTRTAPRDAWAWLASAGTDDRISALRKGEAIRTVALQDPGAAFAMLSEMSGDAFYPLAVRGFFFCLVDDRNSG
ncbi:MAG: hypothetical protein LR015_14880 [Verrucomicrobia bacterium]|nr:hypothetical protein [Verrucomicrobiota bacterium]